jgi:hypothetical protein
VCEQADRLDEDVRAAEVLWRHRRGGRQELARGLAAVGAGRLEEGRGALRTARVALGMGGDAEGAAAAEAGLLQADEAEAASMAATVRAQVGRLEAVARLLERAVALGAVGDWQAARARARRRACSAAGAGE